MGIKTYSVWTKDGSKRVSPKFESYACLGIWLSANKEYSNSNYKVIWT